MQIQPEQPNTRKPAIPNSKSDVYFKVFNYVFVTFFLIITLYPILFVVSASFSDAEALMGGEVWLWPVRPTLEGYQVALAYSDIWTGFFNSTFYAIVGTIINLVMTILAAYPLSRKDLQGRNSVTFLFAFTMWFSGGMIPSYLLIRDLHLLNTRWALLLPGAISVYNMIITRTFFQANIPDELLESSKLDGCSDFGFLTRVVIPLSKPILAVITLFYIVGHWNAYFNAFLYLNDRELMPLQIFLREILVMNQTGDITSGLDMAEMAKRDRMAELLKYSLIVISTLPIAVIYPFVQKFFVQGIMVGAIKG